MTSVSTTQTGLTPQLEAQIAGIAERYHKEPHQLMRILLDIQKAAGNAVPREAAVVISRVTGIPEAKLYGFISYYAMTSAETRGKYVVRMCESAPCHVTGAGQVMESIVKTLGIKPGETSADGRFTLEFCQCLGMCEFSPTIMVNDTVYKNLTPGRAATLMEDYMRGDVS